MRSVVKIAVALIAFILSYAPASASAQVTLPYSEGWENTMGGTFTAFQASLPGAPEWSYDNTITGEGRLRFDAGAGFVNNGMFAATLDRTSFGGVQTNFLLGTLDMSNYNAANDVVLLSFATSNHGDEDSPNDRVWIRGSDADMFIEIVDLTALTAPDGVYESVTDVDISNALLTNGQNFSATFQIRFGQEDNGNANNPTGIDGRSFDDIELALLPPNDVGATGVDAPGPNACGVSMTDVIVAVTNFGSAPQMNVPVQVMVSGAATATFNVTVPGPIAYGTTEQVVAGQVDLFTGGTITVDAVTQLMGDSDAANDATQSTVDTLPTEIPLNPPAVGCPQEAGVLSVMGEPGVTYGWWDAPTMGTELATGDMFMTPPVMGPTTYYVERQSSQFSLGPMDNTFGSGGQYGQLQEGLVFDTTVPIVINTVYAYPGTAGDITINVVDDMANAVDSATIAVTSADVGQKTALHVGLQVPVGTGFELTAAGSTVNSLYRNNGGGAIPYASANGEVTITETTNNLGGSGFYYFFYDWQVTAGGCGGERTAVVVDADEMACTADLVVTKVGPATANAGEQVTYTITVTNNGPTGAYSVVLDDPGATGLTFDSNSGDCITAFPCDIGYLAAGASAVVDATFTVEPTFSGTISNTATATSSAGEAMPGDESATANVDVTQSADLSIAISGVPDPVAPTGTITYTVDVTNNGPSDASNVQVDTTLPAELTFETSSGCSNDPAGVPACLLDTIPSGTTATFTLDARVASDFLGTTTTSATVSSDATEANPGDETASVEITVSTDGSLGAGGGGGSGSGSGGGFTIEDSGCGCRQAGGDNSPTYGWLVLLGMASLGLRRRRRQAA